MFDFDGANIGLVFLFKLLSKLLFLRFIIVWPSLCFVPLRWRSLTYV